MHRPPSSTAGAPCTSKETCFLAGATKGSDFTFPLATSTSPAQHLDMPQRLRSHHKHSRRQATMECGILVTISHGHLAHQCNHGCSSSAILVDTQACWTALGTCRYIR
jgi:hypothetical protein